MRVVHYMFLFLTGAVSAGAAARNATQASLLLSADAAKPGDTILAGVRLQMEKGWHTYWRNSGESGKATEIEWKLPAGLKAGPIQWPPPERLMADDLTTYVYDKEVVLLVPLTVAANAPRGEQEIVAKVSWLECEVNCVPGDATLRAKLNIGDEAKASTNADLLKTWQGKIPRPEPGLQARSWWEKGQGTDTRLLVIEWTPLKAGVEGDFLPYENDQLEVSPKTDRPASAPGTLRLSKTVKKLAGNWPIRIDGLLTEKGGGATPPDAYEVSLAVEPAPPAGRAPSTSAGGATAGGGGLLLVNLALAFLGGLILNLMPCVLPVIALKILSFVHQSGGSAAQMRKLGLVYGVGVLVSFLVLGGVVVAVQRAGHVANWGMQFQNPKFLVAITTLVTLVALNLFGLFEVTLGGVVGAAGKLASREGIGGAFFNGVLAVVLATPCTAPFLATALGFAFAQPPLVVLLIFTAVACGLALPYVLLSFFPQLRRFLPKPGAWMEKFKIAMGFPMLATAVWLYSVARAQLDKDDSLRFGLFLVALALAAWIWGDFVQRGAARRGLAMAISFLLLAGTGLYALSGPSDQIRWQPWSSAAVEKARADGRPVLVDFTADWCLTCQANKRTSIEIPSVRSKLKETKAVPLLGDYTRVDPAITAELQHFGRAGVPLVLVYPKNASKPPIVLPALLRPHIMLEALDKAAE
jgi:thiol:disulfide interchange protein/DsbC/DsbD-like thiol-disulfide interchange protein